jgi:glucose-6-phosphate 1-dehydrogenase
MIERLVLFGSTGDLAGRFLLPALARLLAAGQLPADFRVVGAAVEPWTDSAFRAHAAAQLREHAGDIPPLERTAFTAALHYRAIDFSDVDTVRHAVEAASTEGGQPQPVVAYLALPTAVFPAAVSALCAFGLPDGSRVALEKPFGEDLDSAKALNAQLRQLTGVAGERAIFRVDHVLGMATVQNLLTVRLANRVLEPIWNSAHIETVDIMWEETLALEGRASYYDKAGALKDVVQNHLMQVLCFVAMEPPVSLDEQDLRDRKLDLLRSVPSITADHVEKRTRRLRYTAGVSAETGESIPSYVDEEGVDPQRGTETYAEVVLEIDNWRWQGTRFRLWGGKALAERRKEVVVHFRPVPPLPFGESADDLRTNELVIGIDGPYDLRLRITGMISGPPSHLAPLQLDTELSAPELPAYSRVLMDVLTGDSRLSIRGDEAEESWRILDPVLRAWADDVVPMGEYAAGTAGPLAEGGVGTVP